MTNKQVIVNDIAVSECEFLITNNDKQLCRCIKSDLFGGIEFVENAKNGNCKDNPDCYYKQLKRLELKLKVTEADYEASEQECEELKKANIHIDNNRMVKSNKLKKIEEYCRKQNLKADYTAYEILQIIDEVE